MDRTKYTETKSLFYIVLFNRTIFTLPKLCSTNDLIFYLIGHSLTLVKFDLLVLFIEQSIQDNKFVLHFRFIVSFNRTIFNNQKLCSTRDLFFFTHIEHSQTMVKFDLLLLWIEQSIPRQKVCSTSLYLIEQSSPCQNFVLLTTFNLLLDRTFSYSG